MKVLAQVVVIYLLCLTVSQYIVRVYCEWMTVKTWIIINAMFLCVHYQNWMRVLKLYKFHDKFESRIQHPPPLCLFCRTFKGNKQITLFSSNCIWIVLHVITCWLQAEDQLPAPKTSEVLTAFYSQQVRVDLLLVYFQRRDFLPKQKCYSLKIE